MFAKKEIWLLTLMKMKKLFSWRNFSSFLDSLVRSGLSFAEKNRLIAHRKPPLARPPPWRHRAPPQAGASAPVLSSRVISFLSGLSSHHRWGWLPLCVGRYSPIQPVSLRMGSFPTVCLQRTELGTQKPGTLIPVLDTNPLPLLLILLGASIAKWTASVWQPKLNI